MSSNKNGNSKRRKSGNFGDNVGDSDSKSGHGSTSKRPRFQSPDETERPPKQSSQAPHANFISSAVPLEISVLKFTENRARELDALSQAVEHVGGTKLSFQRLPKHMRRRAMSHNIRRIPQRLRLKAQIELDKREKKTSNKRPSRRHRRRPGNLMLEYQRRQRHNAWLETHIWHAKRFKMTTMWGYRLPLHPSDKSLRSCYRATTHHCLLQDVSYECCVELRGNRHNIIDALNHLCSKETGLTFAARTAASGQRWGKVILYSCDSYPQKAVGPVTFLWKPNATHGCEGDGCVGPGEGSGEGENISKLWMWCHPACYSAVWAQLSQACAIASPPSRSDSVSEESTLDSECTKSKVGQDAGSCLNSSSVCASEVSFGKLILRSLKDQMVKLRLTGPASNLVLHETLKVADISSASDLADPQLNASGDGQGTPSKRWWQQYYSTEERISQFRVQDNTWQRVARCQSPGEVPPRAVLALTVRDPRVLLPAMRTKAALHEAESAAEVMTWEQLSLMSAISPLWDEAVRTAVTKDKLTEQEINKRRSQLLVPGSALQLGDDESRIPILLLQQPGSQITSRPVATTMRAAVGIGWDLVVPKGWGMALWVAMVYRGARVGGLREACSLSTRSGQLHYPRDFPDCSAGLEQQRQITDEAINRHVRRPPGKRINHYRLGVPAPFSCPFSQLVYEWQAKVPHMVKTSDENTGGDSFDKNTGNQISTNNKEKRMKNDDRDCVADTGDGSSISVLGSSCYVLRCQKLLRWLQESVQGMNSVCRKKGQNPVGMRLSTLLNRPQCHTLISENVHSLVPVVTSCLLRGVPTARAMVCLPSAADLELLAKNSNFGGPVESLHQRCQKLADQKKKKGKLVVKTASKSATVDNKGNFGTKGTKNFLNAKQQEEKNQLLEVPDRIMNACDRTVIGFLTDGDFDLGQGHGSGIGFCSLVGLLQALETQNINKPLLVLVRNPVSRQYRFAHLFISL